jgi:signal peptidase I
VPDERRRLEIGHLSARLPVFLVTPTPPLARRLILGTRPAWTAIRVAIIVFAAYVVFGYVLIPVRGSGQSMTPTLADGELTFVNTLAYIRRPPARGDIVALRLAGARIVYIKRIIGMPGERVAIENGTLFINGSALDEPYVKYRGSWNVPEVTLGTDRYLFIGDNRAMSIRQHDFGTARLERVVGRIVWLRE